ncbi:maleylacetoacetate isomerase-like [Amphibalanus amphitrite]|uniref:maleylacetoacetate isomerase-like n=1 Tax=Amphibalanus amphitrite TaxID=1232801 RepID=UPI001C9186E3|nr:maleylacetoacetate isomerase-like [Amphibalanus amphitrite]
MILYSFFMSSCSWRVRVALRAKGIDYEYRPINLLKGEQRGEEFLKVNPMGQVPTFIDGDLMLTQSMAILEYLEELQPEPSLLPSDRSQRAIVRQICEMINAGIQPVQSGAYARLEAVGGEGAGLAWGQEAIDKGFTALEGVLAKTAGTHCVGDELTLADCCLVPQVLNAQLRFKVDTTKFPIITRLHNYLVQRPEFADTHPEKMVDCPPGFMAGIAAKNAAEKR